MIEYLTKFLPEYIKPYNFNKQLLMDEMTAELNDLTEINKEIELPQEVRLRIYSYLTLNEVIDVIINLSINERIYIGDNSDEELFKWSEERIRKVVLHLNT